MAALPERPALTTTSLGTGRREDGSQIGATTRTRTSGRPWALALLAVIGFALIVLPLFMGMFERAPKGAAMLGEFKPLMTRARLDGFHTDLRLVDGAVRQTSTSVYPYLISRGASSNTLDDRFSSFAQLREHWPSIDSTMTTLLNKVHANLGNYQGLAKLPSFTLFPWFFVLPGIVLLASAGIALARPRSARRALVVVVLVGQGLVLAPVAFGMFQRAPGGAQMMSDFRNIETTANVQRIQSYFSTMAGGQGDIRLGIVPELEQRGLTGPEIASTFPAVSTLDGDWVHILNDMTPMIGAMSDNVPRYEAIAALPSFRLFPWFFAGPGLLILVAVVVALRKPVPAEPDRRGHMYSHQNNETRG